MGTTRSIKQTSGPLKPQTPSSQTPVQQLRGLLDGIAQHKFKRVIVMAGAGISTAAGIPDFRSPRTGLYDNLQKLNLPYPEAVFDISYLRRRPEAFFMLAEEMYPTQFQPTTFHRLVKWISDMGALKRIYTQNIDTLERVAGVPGDEIVEAHGSFAAVHCIDCHKEADKAAVEKLILAKAGQIPRCVHCNGIVKPDIVFFGEALPHRFFDLQETDFEDVDLAIVAGSSLQVSPFNMLPDMVPKGVPRVLLNMDRVGSFGSRKNDDLIVLGKLENLDSIFEEYISAEEDKESSTTTTETVKQSETVNVGSVEPVEPKEAEDAKKLKEPVDEEGPSSAQVDALTAILSQLGHRKPAGKPKDTHEGLHQDASTGDKDHKAKHGPESSAGVTSDASEPRDTKSPSDTKPQQAEEPSKPPKDARSSSSSDSKETQNSGIDGTNVPQDASTTGAKEPREPAGDEPSDAQVSAISSLLTRLGLDKQK